MPSASNKLEKQASIGSVHAGGGGGGGGGGPGVQPAVATAAAATSPSVSSGKGLDANSNATLLDNAINATTSVNANNSSATATNENSVTGSSSNNNNSSSTKGAPVAAGAAAAANANATEANNPLKQALIIIEHKIRNLEKRKTKLESYRAIQATGKELSSDQKAAVAKYDAVMATLDFGRDLSKQMLQILKDAEKEQKKQARKDVVARAQAETVKIREVLIIQNILSNLNDDTVRSDFLNGENGAIKMESADIAALGKFYTDVMTRRPESADDMPFVNTAQKAAEYLSMTIDGRPKQYSDTITYENLRRIFSQIQDCGYLDKIYQVTPEPVSEPKDDELLSIGGGAECEDDVIAEDNLLEESMDKLHVANESVDGGAHEQDLLSADGNGGMLPPQPNALEMQQQQQVPPQQLSEHQQQLDLQQAVSTGMAPPQQQQQQQQQQQHSGGIQAPPAASVPSFQPPPPAGGATVHVAMFSAQQLQPQLQQVPPGSIIGVPQGPPPQLVPVPQPPQQRQLMTSPAAGGGQLPQGAIPLHGAPPPPPGHFTATTVRAVEQSFFKHHQQQQFMQQMRPLAEVIAGGSFYFLQDSELDSPEIGNVAAPVSGVFEQQPQQVPPPAQPTNLINHAGERPPSTDIHKAQQQQQQLLANSMQPTQQQQQQQPQTQQPIPTQTFTNQSFPPMQPPAPVASGANVVAGSAAVTNSSNTPTLASNTPSPMFQPKHQQLFSPVAGLQSAEVSSNATQQQQQLLLSEQQQQQQPPPPPMLIMARLAAPQAQTLPQQAAQQQPQLPQPTLGMQPGDVSSNIAAGFLFDNSVVTTLTYDQQMQQQLAVAAATNSALKAASVTEEKKHTTDEPTAHKFNTEPVAVNEWDAISRGGNVTRGAVNSSTTNAAATAALTNALKPGVVTAAGAGAAVIETNKWSTEMNSIGTPPTPSSNRTSKNEWSTGGSGASGGTGSAGGYGEAAAQSSGSAHDSSNHWNSSQNQDGGVHFPNNGRYQRRRGRPNNYGNSSTQQNGGGSGRGGGGGIYFRNNENSTASGSYYQNGGGGGGVYSNKEASGSRYDSGGSYRGPRGGGGNTRGNAPPSRSIGGRGGGGGNSTNATSSSYMNPRQSNRLPMGLENKN